MSCKNQPSATTAVRAGIAENSDYGSVVPPIYLSTNYTFAGYEEKREFDYSRSGNPTRNVLCEALSELEQGAGGVVTASGMGAITTVVQLLAKDDLLVVPHDCYGGSYRLFTHLAAKGNFKLLIIDQTDPKQLQQAFSQKPKMIWLETPSNPLLRIVDIGEICKQANDSDTLVAADNTFLSPLLQQPLNLGADIVIHSTTKYINGHGDVIGGVAIAKDPEIAELLAWWANCLGLTGSAFDSYLTLRGLRTLKPRLKQHQANAQQIVDLLVSHEKVKTVFYPGLPDHPQHELAKKQQNGFGAMVSFELQGGVEQVKQLLAHIELFSLAESLGGVESLICHPATMTHVAMDDEAQAVAGISKSLIRLSIGIEDGDDLVADFKQALDQISL